MAAGCKAAEDEGAAGIDREDEGGAGGAGGAGGFRESPGETVGKTGCDVGVARRCCRQLDALRGRDKSLGWVEVFGLLGLDRRLPFNGGGTVRIDV